MKMQNKIQVNERGVEILDLDDDGSNLINKKSILAKSNKEILDDYQRLCVTYGQSFSYGGAFFIRNTWDA